MASTFYSYTYTCACAYTYTYVAREPMHRHLHVPTLLSPNKLTVAVCRPLNKVATNAAVVKQVPKPTRRKRVTSPGECVQRAVTRIPPTLPTHVRVRAK